MSVSESDYVVVYNVYYVVTAYYINVVGISNCYIYIFKYFLLWLIPGSVSSLSDII